MLTGCGDENLPSVFGVAGKRTMVQLVLVFCLAGSPASCQEHRPVIEQLSPVACLVQAQQLAQDWLADHPKWTLVRWRCEHYATTYKSA
jgi:hypothetical protein